jgi:ABC-type glycerol-3-phosphate transport system substrate-binding protein
MKRDESLGALLEGNTKYYRMSRRVWLSLAVGMFGLWTLLRGLSDDVWALDYTAAALAAAAYAFMLISDLTDEIRSSKSIIAEFLRVTVGGESVGVPIESIFAITEMARMSRRVWLSLAVGMFGLWTLLRGLSDDVWALDYTAAALAAAAYAFMLISDLTDEIRSLKSIIAEFLPGGRQGPGVG